MAENLYKQAPTWLHNLNGESKLFTAQEAVDQAWKDGWFGPKGMVEDSPPISEDTWDTKKSMVAAIKSDPRYDGCPIKDKDSLDTIMEILIKFEVDNGIGEEE